MAILKILQNGEPTLRKKCKPVDIINDRVLTLLDDMTDTMRSVSGVGLAAPQVGVLRRVVVIETEGGELLELINPEIVSGEGEQQEVEGCLSCTGQYALTKRPMKVTIKALDRHGEEKTYTGEGLLARAFCHETDHLDGVLMLDNAIKLIKPEELE